MGDRVAQPDDTQYHERVPPLPIPIPIPIPPDVGGLKGPPPPKNEICHPPGGIGTSGSTKSVHCTKASPLREELWWGMESGSVVGHCERRLNAGAH